MGEERLASRSVQHVLICSLRLLIQLFSLCTIFNDTCRPVVRVVRSNPPFESTEMILLLTEPHLLDHTQLVYTKTEQWWSCMVLIVSRARPFIQFLHGKRLVVLPCSEITFFSLFLEVSQLVFIIITIL